MQLDKDKIKESLTEEDIEKILMDLGSERPHSDRKGNAIFTTVCHGGHNHKLYYHSNSLLFRCYTECGKNMDIYQLVMDAKATQGFTYTFPQALRYVAELTNKRIVTKHHRPNGFGMENTLVDDWDWINKVTHTQPKMTERLPKYDEAILDVFMKTPHDSWLDEGITETVMKEAEIGWYFMKDAITIPHRDDIGRLIGLRQRSTLKEDVDAGRKYIPIQANGEMYNHTTAYNLYNLNKSKEAIEKVKKIIIYEGEKSCLLNRVYYGDYDFSVAVCGSNVSSWQVEKILSLGVEEVFIAFDKFRDQKEHESDKVYEIHLNNYKDKLLRIAHMFTPYLKTYILYDDFNLLEAKESPIDNGKHTLEELMKNKYEIQTKDVEI